MALDGKQKAIKGNSYAGIKRNVLRISGHKHYICLQGLMHSPYLNKN